MLHPLDTEIYIRTIRKFSKLLDLLIEELEERKRERDKQKEIDLEKEIVKEIGRMPTSHY